MTPIFSIPGALGGVVLAAVPFYVWMVLPEKYGEKVERFLDWLGRLL